jgi:hypothetical protein
VGKLLVGQSFSLQANVKTLEGKQHPDRDAQFRYLNEQVKQHQAAGEPVISVDTKKREQLGRLPNSGREWRPRGQPVEVEDHSLFFTGPEVEQAIPYGIYDLVADAGWVNVGVDHDTSAFAVASIRRWWAARGRVDYPHATRLLITADAGGWNSYRYRAWKADLAELASDTGPGDHGLPFPAGHLKVEQDRAPAVFPHHPQLARSTADQPRGRGQHDRRHPDPYRVAGARRTRHGQLPSGQVGEHAADGCPAVGTSPGTWLLELHPAPPPRAPRALEPRPTRSATPPRPAARH